MQLPTGEGVRETGAKDNDGDSCDDAFSPRCEGDWCQGQ